MKSGISYLAIMFCLIATHFAFGQSNLNRLNTIHTVTFGDSLTDNELLFLLPAPFGNPDGRIVFGQDSVEALFTKAVGPEDQLTNFAVLGSVSGRGDCGYPFEQTCGVLSQVEECVALRRAGAIASAAVINAILANELVDVVNDSFISNVEWYSELEVAMIAGITAE